MLNYFHNLKKIFNKSKRRRETFYVIETVEHKQRSSRAVLLNATFRERAERGGRPLFTFWSLGGTTMLSDAEVKRGFKPPNFDHSAAF